MKNPRKAILLVVLVSLLGTLGAAPFCASCGPKLMDCCKSSGSRAESLQRPVCCEFHMVGAAEPHPARLSPSETGFPSAMAPCAMSDSAFHAMHAGAPLRGPGSSADSLKDSSPPIFLLNASLLC